MLSNTSIDVSYSSVLNLLSLTPPIINVLNSDELSCINLLPVMHPNPQLSLNVPHDL